jgi:hypothetical protein
MLLPTNATTDRMEFIDERGLPAGKVNLPRDPQLFGLEKGTVYLQRPIPVAAPASGSPAQAA